MEIVFTCFLTAYGLVVRIVKNGRSQNLVCLMNSVGIEIPLEHSDSAYKLHKIIIIIIIINNPNKATRIQF